jgi:hypothetical protein
MNKENCIRNQKLLISPEETNLNFLHTFENTMREKVKIEPCQRDCPSCYQLDENKEDFN